MRKPSKLSRLKAAGFDRSRYMPSERAWAVRCSQCEALVICGVACHETGCINKPHEEREED